MENADFRSYSNIHRDGDVCARTVTECRKLEKTLWVIVFFIVLYVSLYIFSVSVSLHL